MGVWGFQKIQSQGLCFVTSSFSTGRNPFSTSSSQAMNPLWKKKKKKKKKKKNNASRVRQIFEPRP